MKKRWRAHILDQKNRGEKTHIFHFSSINIVSFACLNFDDFERTDADPEKNEKSIFSANINKNTAEHDEIVLENNAMYARSSLET